MVEAIRIVEQSIDSGKKRIMKHDESNGDSEFTAVISFRGKLLRS